MPDFYKGKIPIVYRSLNEAFIRGMPDLEPVGGCTERDFSVDPVEMRDSPAELKLYDPSEYDAVYDEQEREESSLEHLYLRNGQPAFQHLDQSRFPDCWCHSVAHQLMLDMLKMHVEVLRINAVAMATMIGRTNGGWSGLAMKFARDNGVPLIGTGPGEWPQWTREKRYDTSELRETMKLRRADEVWYDFGKQVYDQKMTRRQLDTCGLSNVPCATDWNRFGHAMCQVRRVRLERGHWGDLTLNSWQGFGFHGLCVLADMTPDNAVGLRSSTPSVRKVA
jgi:hypothetical protein